MARADDRHSCGSRDEPTLLKTNYMIGILNEAQIETLLATQLIGRIGCYANGSSYIVPISFAYDGESVYAHTHEGQKTAMMRTNPEVCFEVDDVRDTANWQSVIAWGRYEELSEPREREHALRVLMNRELPLSSSSTTHLGQHWPFSSGDLDKIKGVVFRIRLQTMTGRFETNAEEPAFHY